MANGARMIRLLGGPEARPRAVSFMHEQTGLGRRVRAKRWVARCGSARRGAGSSCPRHLADKTHRQRGSRRPGASRRSTWSPTICRAPRRCPNAWPSWPADCCPPVNAASTPSPTNWRCIRGRCNDDWPPRACDARTSSNGERRDQAARYLAEPRLHLSQIAGLLGYTEQSTFNRSCRRWFGRLLGSTGRAVRRPDLRANFSLRGGNSTASTLAATCEQERHKNGRRCDDSMRLHQRAELHRCIATRSRMRTYPYIIGHIGHTSH